MAKCLYFRQSMTGPEQGPKRPQISPPSWRLDPAMSSDRPTTSAAAVTTTAGAVAVASASPAATPLSTPPPPPSPSSPTGLLFSGLLSSSSCSSPSDAAAWCLPSALGVDGPPTLSEAILETDIFLRSIGISDDCSGQCKLESSDHLMEDPDEPSNATPTNLSPILTPKIGSPIRETSAAICTNVAVMTSQTPRASSSHISDLSSNCSSLSDGGGGNSGLWGSQLSQSTVAMSQQLQTRPTGPFRSLVTGLETIPEDGVTEPPSIYQPLVPPMIPKPATTSYNISFPTTLQPRDRYDFWTRAGLSPATVTAGAVSSGMETAAATLTVVNPTTTLPAPSPCIPTPPVSRSSHQYLGSSPASSSIPPSPGSVSSQQSPFHGAVSSSPWDPAECQPLNVIREDGNNDAVAPIRKSKPSKRSRSSCSLFSTTATTGAPASVSALAQDEEDVDDGASCRQKRKSTASMAAENKRRDSIKYGLEELQRILPHVGTPEEEKISQASVLYEAGKYIRTIQGEQTRLSEEIEAVKQQIDELNNQIEAFQSQLPANGAPLLPKVLTMQSLCDQFHDHVVRRTKENWRYWVFVNIMGHFVHSFEQQVSAANFEELQATGLEYIANNLTLQQLRKDAYRKLAKLCAKTSIVDNPEKLPEEALSFVTRGERAYTKRTT